MKLNKLVSMKPGIVVIQDLQIAQLKMELAQLQMIVAQMQVRSGVFTRISVFQLMIFAVHLRNSSVKSMEYQYAYQMSTVAKIMNNGVN